jgi:hypothetical protein
MTIPNDLKLSDLPVDDSGFSIFSTDSGVSPAPVTRSLKVRKAPSLFSVITGPRGSLKTLLLTMLACRNLLKCFYLRYYGITRHVWTNYPIGFYHRSVLDDKVYYLRPEPLNMESLYTFDAGLAAGWVCIDEIDQWYDRQDWAAVTQKLTNAVITQIRKRELSLLATTQNFQWLNARAQFQTDTLINCREAAFTTWGRKFGVQMGHVSFLTLKDLSGVNTGFQYSENFRTYSTKLTHGERYWDKYDTNFQFDPMETKARYSIKRDAKTLVLGPGGYKVESTGQLDQMSSKSADPDMDLFSHVIEDLRDQGLTHVKSADIWRAAGELGWRGQVWQAGATLSKLGLARNRYGYILRPELEGNESEDGRNVSGACKNSPHAPVSTKKKVVKK